MTFNFQITQTGKYYQAMGGGNGTYEPGHEISNNVVCANSKASDQRLCNSLEYSVSAKLLTKHRLEFLSLKGGCTGSSECTLIKMPHCWKSYVTAHM